MKILKVEDDGCWIRDCYGLEQKIDWEDIDQYNPKLVEEEPVQSFAGYLNNLFKSAAL